MSKPNVAFITWSFVSGRSRDIAAALEGETRVIYHQHLTHRYLVPLRYFVSSIQTVAYLLRKRPRSVIATLPPVFPGAIAWLYSLFFGVPFLLDSHPSGFGRKSDRVSARLLPVHRWLCQRAAATLVTTNEWANTVDRWGGRGLVLHEAPLAWEVAKPKTSPSRPLKVLFVCVFGPDEPVREVIEAARATPEVHMTITGNTRRVSPDVVANSPGNVTFCGFLDDGAYRTAVEDTDVILALTTEPTSVMRAAYEAIYSERPLVATDHEQNRKLFENAILVDNYAAGIKSGLEKALENYESLVRVAGQAREAQLERWERQLSELRGAISGESDTK